MSGAQLPLSDKVPGQIYLTSYSVSRDISRICPAPSPDMSGLSALSRVKSPEPDLSSSIVGFQRWLPDMSVTQPGHVRVSDTPMNRFPWGAIKVPHACLAHEATHLNLQTLLDTLFSSKSLYLKLHSNLSFLGEI
jgi:hypothetical protein